ncbi:MAG: D-glycero-beta-D-manno-heptose 1-phosphate adenylyltransferase [Candidatus Gastranaerophilales bacterium]|nr:D-glycero-beta-D-manno-heptose 1-phosphate adenylyltransferase [Candidatus Gastranaerophilales bacterium]
MGQVIARKEAGKLALKLKKQGKTSVFTNGCFDILHVGHVRYLKESARYGDVLIVGLNSDTSVKRLKGESRPINNESDRAELLSELGFVDYVVIFDEDTPEALLDEIKPNIYTKGADYTLETLPEAKIVIKNGGCVEFIDLVAGKSTTNVIKKIEQK